MKVLCLSARVCIADQLLGKEVCPAAWIIALVPFFCSSNKFLLYCFVNIFFILIFFFCHLYQAFLQMVSYFCSFAKQQHRNPMWSAYDLYIFKPRTWMFPGLYVLIFTLFCRPSLVGFGCSFFFFCRVWIHYKCVGSCFVNRIPKLPINTAVWLPLLDFRGLKLM